MINETKVYLSQKKFDELTEELAFLQTKKRAEIAERLKQAKSYGDLSENAEYHQARDAQAEVESRIMQLITLLKSANIVEHHKSDSVEVGTTVTVDKDGEEKVFEIVGSEEADTAAGKLSLDSPLGSTMIGKRKDEQFVFKAPSGKSFTFKILKIG